MDDITTRTQTHATFVIERSYRHAVEAVWMAFADTEAKQRWFGGPEFSEVEFAEDFRVGGTAINHGRTPDGHLSEFRATYTDILEHQRIVYTYDMWLDRVHASTSITTIALEPVADGTLLTCTEQGVYLDGVHGPGADAAAGREHGTGWLLDRLGESLTM